TLYVWNTALGSLNALGDVDFIDNPHSKVGYAVVNGLLFFSGDDYLWVSDGAKAGTHQVLDASGFPLGLPYGIQAFAGGVYCTASSGIYQTDGTQAGTLRVLSLFEPNDFEPHELVAAGPRLFFRKWDPAIGTELWALEAN
ncbi:MAG TPA: hypothetical protein VF173_06685, partial [Thermoanaerobaculia bacterium]|nr:hypothetical protein [Thermoanaerobaculia bacterium]